MLQRTTKEYNLDAEMGWKGKIRYYELHVDASSGLFSRSYDIHLGGVLWWSLWEVIEFR